MKILKECTRFEIIELLRKKTGNIGLELGVAGGVFSKAMIESQRFDSFFGVDIYGDHHSTQEYINALKYIGLNANYKLLRMKFDEALEVFEDESLDFVYVDGYAHTGEEGGKTLFDWYEKVKVGGVIAGDDFHDDWPGVVRAVTELSKQANLDLSITGKKLNSDFSYYPSWGAVKTENKPLNYPSSLGARSKVESYKYTIKSKIKKILRRNL